MKKTINTKGFTLVELIIVITILVILATIAFVSFQGYAANSRDTKRQTELGNIRNSIEVKASEGISVLSFVESTGSSLSALNLGGVALTSTATTIYKAGDISFPVLGGDKDKYTDAYKIGASTKAGGVYQLAATLESDVKSSYIVGNYKPRTTATGALNSSTSPFGTLKVGDFIRTNLLATGSFINSISSDKSRITATLNGGTTPVVYSGSDVVGLWVEDSAGLISSVGSTGSTAVLNKSTTTLPY